MSVHFENRCEIHGTLPSLRGKKPETRRTARPVLMPEPDQDRQAAAVPRPPHLPEFSDFMEPFTELVKTRPDMLLDHQILPEPPWRVFLLIAGRGAGKTHAMETWYTQAEHPKALWTLPPRNHLKIRSIGAVETAVIDDIDMIRWNRVMWENILLITRVGPNPRIMVTATDPNRPLVEHIAAQPGTVVRDLT